MDRIKRSSLYACHSLPKNRPALVLTRNAVIPHLDRVTVVPAQSRDRGIQTEVRLDPDRDGVPKACVLSCDNVVTVKKNVLGTKVAEINILRMNEVRNSILFAIGFTIPPEWRTK